MKLFSERSDYDRTFDAVIVGSGLTGAWAAKELSESGFHVLLLDAGPLLSPLAMTDLSWWNQKHRRSAALRQPTQARHTAYWTSNPQLFVDDVENPYASDTDFVWIRGMQVGGRSLTWGGVALRFSDHEFLAPERDGFGARWPICYRDLEPCYEKIEQFLNLQESDDGVDRLLDADLDCRPRFTETERRFKVIVESRWPGRKVIGCRATSGKTNAGSKDTWPVKTNLHATIPAALATGRCTLRPDSVVCRLLAGPGATTVQGVSCVDRATKRTFEVFGRAVLLCASPIESVRIMLNSACASHPRGLGNSSGLLGRYLMDHMGVTVAGVVPNSGQMTRHPWGGANGICIPRFRNVHEPFTGFIRGYGIRAGLQRGQAAANARRSGGSDGAAWSQTALLEVLPNESNGVSLNAGRVDHLGIPTVRIHLAYGENERRMKADALRCMLEMSEAADLDVDLVHVTEPGRTAHEVGGARMGADPGSSVLDPWNRCWDVSNLFVLDGSCFVTSGWQDPALTMMAIADRACGHIARGLASGVL